MMKYFISIITLTISVILLRLVFSYFDIVHPNGIVLCCYQKRFPFLSVVNIFSWEILLICCLRYPYSYFSSDICFLVIFVLLIFVLLVLFLMAIISLPLHFLMESPSRCIDTSTLSWMQQVLFLLLILTYTVCLRHFWDVRPFQT